MRFSDALNVPTEDIKQPKPVPVGDYRVSINGHEINERTSKADGRTWEALDITLEIVEPINVDADDLADYDDDVVGKKLRHGFMISAEEGADNTGALFALRRFLEATVQAPGSTMSEMLENATDRHIGVTVVHEPSKREGDDSKFARVHTTFPVD